MPYAGFRPIPGRGWTVLPRLFALFPHALAGEASDVARRLRRGTVVGRADQARDGPIRSAPPHAPQRVPVDGIAIWAPAPRRRTADFRSGPNELSV